jgi:hypothetical protein
MSHKSICSIEWHIEDGSRGIEDRVEIKTNLLHRKDPAPTPHLAVSRMRYARCPHEAKAGGLPVPATNQELAPAPPTGHPSTQQDLRSSGSDLWASTSAWNGYDLGRVRFYRNGPLPGLFRVDCCSPFLIWMGTKMCIPPPPFGLVTCAQLLPGMDVCVVVQFRN